MTCLTRELKQTESIKLSKIIGGLFKQDGLLFFHCGYQFFFFNHTSSFKAQFSSCWSPNINSISGVSRALHLSSHQRAVLSHPSRVYHAVKLSLLSPIGVVNVPLLAQAFAHTPGGARQSEIPVWKLEGAVRVRLTGRLLGAGVVQVGELQLARHSDELPRLEVQQGHGSQGRLGQEVEEPNQIQTHLGGEQISVNINLTNICDK